MKIYLKNFNGVLDELETYLKDKNMFTEYIHHADAAIIWQDVRGDLKDFTQAFVSYNNKPVYIVEHGRGATRDYCPPNKFPLLATKIFVWGESDRMRLLGQGIPENKIKIIGCPLFTKLIAKVPHQGKKIMFCPVISTKEEPENMMVYCKLKQWEFQKLFEKIANMYPQFKRIWATKVEYPNREEIIQTILPQFFYDQGQVVAKLSPVHDYRNYQCPIEVSNPLDKNHVTAVIASIAEVDAVVCLEEGTLPLLAHAMNVPVVLVDVFRYGSFGGTENYDKELEVIKTEAAYVINSYDKIYSTLDHALAFPKEKEKPRIRICEFEGGASVAPSWMKSILEEVCGTERKSLVTA